jgi:hypothetical protein
MEATICTVVTPLHYRLMGINHGLIQALNPTASLRWLCVDNQNIHVNNRRFQRILTQTEGDHENRSQASRAEIVDEEKTRYFDAGRITDYLPASTIRPGVPVEQASQYFSDAYRIRVDDTARLSLLDKYLGSYHHASGLDAALSEVKTRFAVIIDPDLYVVRPSWITEIIDHMITTDTALFGVPWNPRWHQKYRYFPCSHLMVIDFEKLEYRRDLLAPDLLNAEPKYVSNFWSRIKNARQEKLWTLAKILIKHSLGAVSQDRKQRQSIGMSRDTGYRLIEEFKKQPALKYETAIPVFAPEIEGFEPNAVTRMQYSSIVQSLMPDERCYVPKKAGAISRTGFMERGLPDFRGLRWEEFIWQNSPLAFHVRGELHRQPWGQIDIGELLRRLNVILAGYGLPPLRDPEAGVEAAALHNGSARSNIGVAVS